MSEYNELFVNNPPCSGCSNIITKCTCEIDAKNRLFVERYGVKKPNLDKLHDMGTTESLLQSGIEHFQRIMREWKMIDKPKVNPKYANRHLAFRVWATAIETALECGFNEAWVVKMVYEDSNSQVPNEDLMMARNLFDWSAFASLVRKLNGND